MNKKNEFSIGDFSEKTGIPIPTLHYYDELGILRPDKNPSSGHRIYKYQDIITLQKILSLKFLGYSLDETANLLTESSFNMDLNKSLLLHLQAFEKEKEQMEQSIKSIKRVMELVKEEEEIDSTILFSLIHNMRSEPIHEAWMQRQELTDVAKDLSMKSEEEKLTIDKIILQLSNEVKQLYGQPFEDPKVQAMVKAYVEASYSFVGEDSSEKLANIHLENLDIEELRIMAPSPFTEDEEKWLNQAMELYMKKEVL
ncbi:MerR family transcriptional regulator [Alkalihalobacillus trypoxylicola]|uniref:MerR family transcriptional regulator n=1 Tax=Alkalihalobacillus trypoxylicola TaxID=519424 RepID=A0A161Q8G0_9BACI|nr:MerR family transcriptional regulator [Alkalihalobacillus trypoxylicola]KYG33395.1 MerR family transcriptional regulator [Alkalihalobacillus trypoxylicola]